MSELLQNFVIILLIFEVFLLLFINWKLKNIIGDLTKFTGEIWKIVKLEAEILEDHEKKIKQNDIKL